jgi:putative ABC transport system substrate-binding protein
VARIGYLGVASPTFGEPYRKAFGDGLRDLGWIEGQNLLVEERFAEGNYDRLPALAAELVRRKVDVIVASGATAAIRAAQQATSTIPIVMTVGLDPVEQGLISSVRRPGGNITGVAWEPDPTIAGKHLQFLTDMIPGLRRVGVLFDRAEPATVLRTATEQAAVKLGLTLDYVGIEAPNESKRPSLSSPGEALRPCWSMDQSSFSSIAVRSPRWRRNTSFQTYTSPESMWKPED